jgi:hypothetical protein
MSEHFLPGEYVNIMQVIYDMVELLDDAIQEASDPPDATLIINHDEVSTRRGRPRFHIDPTFLSFALESRGPKGIANVLGCCPRTVRRWALDFGLLEAGEAPLFGEVLADNGTTQYTRLNTPRHTRLSDISDDELDRVLEQILQIFPRYGRGLIDGDLRSRGLLVSRTRITHSYLRVRGPPPPFNQHRIVRRQYNVAGANSLWHHDGQHGKHEMLR